MDEEEMNIGETRHVHSIKDKLQQVADEIDTIKSSFSKSTEDLSKIKNMLEVDNLDEIGTIMNNFETRISEVEKQKEEATEGARKYSEELEKEKERLIKLWDAYKNQEEELSTTEKKMIESEELMKNHETEKNQLESDLTARISTLNDRLQENESKVQQFDDYKQRCEEFDGIRNLLEEEIHNLKDAVNTRDETIKTLQTKVEELKELEKLTEIQEKFDEVSVNYEKEKERLAKLYHLYEESENESKKLRDENNNWQNWFDSNKDIFDRLFSAGPPVNTKNNEPESELKTKSPSKKSKPKKKKKKLLLR